VQNASSSLEIASFESDVNLASPKTECGKAFAEFAQDSGEFDRVIRACVLCSDLSYFTEAWDVTFQGAMHKLSLLGVAQDQLDKMIDCTDIIG
jgi:hypothetical protein